MLGTMSRGDPTEWNLLHCLNKDTDVLCALVILNRPLKPQLRLLQLLWNKASVKAVVDGGCNTLYDTMADDRAKYVPDLITGDFDSVRPEVLEHYRGQGVEVIKTEDQNFTDFTKCLQTLAGKELNKQICSIYVLGAMGGRLDQVFANIESLHTARDLLPDQHVYILSKTSLACLLPPGSHKLHVDSGWEGDWCGLIPVGGACDHVTTTGLKWNLDNQRLKFGELVSTSNTWAADASGLVTVETDKPLLWTMGINLDRDEQTVTTT